MDPLKAYLHNLFVSKVFHELSKEILSGFSGMRAFCEAQRLLLKIL